MLEALALICFIASGVWSAILRSWPLMLMAAGLALWVATGVPVEIE